jgi:catechol 2,3-dioxygenase-like lactoylglutathione lyase family enzyme
MARTAIEVLSEVVLASDDPERLANFYSEVLGFPLEERSDDDGEARWECRLGAVHMVVHGAWARPPEAPAPGTMVLSLCVFDLDAYVTALRQAGVVAALDAERTAVIHDPDGNRIELVEPAGDGASGPGAAALVDVVVGYRPRDGGN